MHMEITNVYESMVWAEASQASQTQIKKWIAKGNRSRMEKKKK